MLEYCSPCTIAHHYRTELCRYYHVPNLDLFLAALPYRQLHAANGELAVVVRGRRLRDCRGRTYELPFVPVAVGLGTKERVFLLDEWGELGIYCLSDGYYERLFDDVLSLSSDAGGFVTKYGNAYILTQDDRLLRCIDRLGIAVAWNWGEVLTFCDTQGHWYMGQQMFPCGATNREVPGRNSIYRISQDGALHLFDGERLPVTLLANVRKITGVNGSVIAETIDGGLHFFVGAKEMSLCT